MDDKILYRHSKPNDFDELPLGTIIHVINENLVDVYQQLSENSSDPKWSLIKTITRS